MISFILNNKKIETDTFIGETLLDFIRENQNLKGTKIGCREGDCGACTVLIGELKNNQVQYHNITSCLSPLGNVHGKHVLTVEGLTPENSLNIAQQEMVNHQGTQCGFCTPGFVVSLSGYVLQKPQHNSHKLSSILDSISGNICRCTGYKSIEKAADAIEEKTTSITSLDDLISKGFVPEYLKEIPEKLSEIPKIKKESSHKYKIVASGTDLYVQQADNLKKNDLHLITHSENSEKIKFENNHCILDAKTTMSELLENEQLQELFPSLEVYFKKISSAPIRNMGTIGGNIVNASPIADVVIILLALHANLIIESPNNKREILLKDFYLGYKTLDLLHEEIITFISFPISKKPIDFHFEKVSKRTHLDIASVNSAMQIELENKIIKEIHLSIGGVAPVPFYTKKTIDFLLNKEPYFITFSRSFRNS